MSKILMCIIGGALALSVLQYFLLGVHYKRHDKEKKVISEELIESLKE